MRRFPDDLLEALRGLSCADLAPDLGLVKARERGKWSCPLCGSSDGLHCYPAGRGARCYVCAANADPIELVRASQGLDFPGAVRWLCDRQGWPCEADQPRTRSLTSPAPAPRFVAPVRAPDAPIWGEMWREREAMALEGGDVSPEHAAQLATRAVDGVVRELWLDLLRDMPRSFGYSPRAESWLSRRQLPDDLALWAGWRACDSEYWLSVILADLVPKYGEELCAAAGLLRKGEPFPKVDYGGEILVMPYWRGEAFDDAPGAVVDTLRFRIIRCDGSRQLLNMPNPDPDGWTPSNARPTWHSPSGPYLLSAAHKARQLTAPDAPLYLCEGESDCLALWACNAPAAATPGASAWRAGWASQLALTSHDAPRAVIVFMDNDEAGERFIDALDRDIIAQDPDASDIDNRVKIYPPTPCKDVGELHERDFLRDTLAQLA